MTLGITETVEEIDSTIQSKQAVVDLFFHIINFLVPLILMHDCMQQLKNDNGELQQEVEILKAHLKEQVYCEAFQHHDEYRQLQEAYEQLREEFHQLKVVADMKRQMPPPSFMESSTDPDEPVLHQTQVRVSLLCTCIHYLFSTIFYYVICAVPAKCGLIQCSELSAVPWGAMCGTYVYKIYTFVLQ